VTPAPRPGEDADRRLSRSASLSSLSDLVIAPLLLLAFLSLLVAGCAKGGQIEWESPVERAHPLVGRIWDVKAESFIAEDTLVARLVASRFALLGERHDNPDHHVLQAKLFRAMVGAGRRPALGFEMLATDDAPAVARHLARSPKDAAGLGDAVNWSRSGWPEWRLYQPIAQVALDANLPIVATNLSRAATEAVRRNGLAGLGPMLMTQLRLTEPTPEMRLAMTRELRESHCGQIPENTIDRMADIQWARDARIAASLARGGQRDGGVLIAGAGHVRRDRGVPVHLARQAPEASLASVAFVEVDAAAEKPADYAKRFGSDSLPFEYVWFTPKVDDADPCEKLKMATETETNPK
jgi:uncharacterized iron-regulated protein